MVTSTALGTFAAGFVIGAFVSYMFRKKIEGLFESIKDAL